MSEHRRAESTEVTVDAGPKPDDAHAKRRTVARIALCALAIITLGVMLVASSLFIATSRNLFSVYDDRDSFQSQWIFDTLDTLGGVIFSCILTPASAISGVVILAIHGLQKRSSPILAAMHARLLLSNCLPTEAVITMTACEAVRGYRGSMHRWETHSQDYEWDYYDEAGGDGALALDWDSTKTAWARLAYRFGYFAFAWYVLMAVYLIYLEPRLDLLGLAFTSHVDVATFMNERSTSKSTASSAAEEEGWQMQHDAAQNGTGVMSPKV